MMDELKAEIERLQSAINVAVWFLEGGEQDAALTLLMRHYNESEESKAARENPDVC